MDYTQEDLQDALDLAKPGRILELDSDGNMSKNCVAAVIHNLCALAEYYDLAKSQEARWYKEFTDETSKHSAAIKRAEEAEAKLAAVTAENKRMREALMKWRDDLEPYQEYIDANGIYRLVSEILSPYTEKPAPEFCPGSKAGHHCDRRCVCIDCGKRREPAPECPRCEGNRIVGERI